MNIDQAKSIPLALILQKLGCKPTREKGQKATYLSPLRIERTPSFHVHNGKNLWYDFGLDKGGTIIQFVCSYLESQNEAHTISDALRWIENMAAYSPAIKPVIEFEPSNEEPDIVLKKKKQIEHPALIKYLGSRGILLKTAMPYIEEVLLYNKQSKKNFFALGMPNEEDGYEVRNQFFKGCVGSKTISFIRGKQPKPEGIHFFEGMMDYVSALSYRKLIQFDEDAIVLNSLSCLKLATPYIKNYGYSVAYTWLDNDTAGERGTNSLAEFFKTEANLQHRRMNDIYHPHKDVNAWHMKQLSLSMS